VTSQLTQCRVYKEENEQGGNEFYGKGFFHAFDGIKLA
jgi:hypothetical protein